MARQEINIGVSANDGNGDPLRTAFSKINSMTTELYLDDAGDVNSIIATAPIARDSATGDVTISLNDGGISTQKIANDGVTFAKLENRYTALSALGSGTAFALNFSTATTFTATASGAATLTFSNAVQGQVIDLIITGNHALTFAETGATFNKVGSTSYAGGSTNLIQIICTDDSSGAKIYHYSIATYAAAQPQ